MDALAMILMLSVGPLVAALTILPNAKRINADWRARRAAKSARRREADIVRGAAAH